MRQRAKSSRRPLPRGVSQLSEVAMAGCAGPISRPFPYDSHLIGRCPGNTPRPQRRSTTAAPHAGERPRFIRNEPGRPVPAVEGRVLASVVLPGRSPSSVRASTSRYAPQRNDFCRWLARPAPVPDLPAGAGRLLPPDRAQAGRERGDTAAIADRRLRPGTTGGELPPMIRITRCDIAEASSGDAEVEVELEG